MVFFRRVCYDGDLIVNVGRFGLNGCYLCDTITDLYDNNIDGIIVMKTYIENELRNYSTS